MHSQIVLYLTNYKVKTSIKNQYYFESKLLIKCFIALLKIKKWYLNKEIKEVLIF